MYPIPTVTEAAVKATVRDDISYSFIKLQTDTKLPRHQAPQRGKAGGGAGFRAKSRRDSRNEVLAHFLNRLNQAMIIRKVAGSGGALGICLAAIRYEVATEIWIDAR
jgi:hypothetical protein